MYGEMSSG